MTDIIAVRVRKSLHLGWVASSEVEILPGFIVELVTCKRYGGEVSSIASVHGIEGGMRTHRVYSDFNKKLRSERYSRVTDKVVRQAHDAALAQWDAVVLEATAHTKKLEGI